MRKVDEKRNGHLRIQTGRLCLYSADVRNFRHFGGPSTFLPGDMEENPTSSQSAALPGEAGMSTMRKPPPFSSG